MDRPSESCRPGDDGLFARARAGDQAAWKQLFDACYPKVVRVVRRRLGATAGMRSLYDSTDFASDVWKSLAAKSGELDFPTVDALMAFLRRAAEQKFIDEYRRLHAQKRDIDRDRPIELLRGERDGDGPTLPAPDPTPSQFVSAAETNQRLLDGLDDEQARVIELRKDGHSNEEIAEATGWHVRKVQRFLKDLHDDWASGPGGPP